MSKIKDVFFGGAEKRAGRKETEALRRAQDTVIAQTKKAEGTAQTLFGAADENLRLGQQGALDVFGQFVPQQLGAFQAGNVGAQEALIQGQDRFRNATLGLPQGPAQQAVQLPVDTSFAQQQLPQFQTSEQALNPAPALGSQMGPFQFDPGNFDFSKFQLGGRF